LFGKDVGNGWLVLGVWSQAMEFVYGLIIRVPSDGIVVIINGSTVIDWQKSTHNLMPVAE